MKALRIIGIVLGSLIVLYVGGCLILPGHFEVKREKELAYTPEKIKMAVADFHAFRQWSPWAKYDPNMKSTITGTPMTVGHKMDWVGNDSVGGHGSMTIASITPTEVVNDLEFKDMNSKSQSKFSMEPTDKGTKLTWSDNGELPFLMRPMGMMMDGFMGKDFERGLDQLDAFLKTMPDSTATPAANN